MTFNLRVDLPQDGINGWANRIEKVSALVLKNEPLVFGAQEVLLHMVNDLKKVLPDYQWIGEGRRGGMKDEFCPIFYNHHKLDCVDAGQFWLSDQPEVPNSISWGSDFPRICTWGQFQCRQEPCIEFTVYNTHLDHVSQLARENGIALIGKRINRDYIEKKIPILLTGDLNSQPKNKVIQFLRGETSINGTTVNVQDVYDWLEGRPGRTFHSFHGGLEGQPIDYIFCTPDAKVLNAEIDRTSFEGRYPSDHYPIIATITL